MADNEPTQPPKKKWREPRASQELKVLRGLDLEAVKAEAKAARAAREAEREARMAVAAEKDPAFGEYIKRQRDTQFTTQRSGVADENGVAVWPENAGKTAERSPSR